jgi:hypothetical protein
MMVTTTIPVAGVVIKVPVVMLTIARPVCPSPFAVSNNRLCRVPVKSLLQRLPPDMATSDTSE